MISAPHVPIFIRRNETPLQKERAHMQQWIKENYPTIGWWTALIAGALILYWVTRGTSYHPLAIGILASSVTLAAAMLLFEAVWWSALALMLNMLGGNSAVR